MTATKTKSLLVEQDGDATLLARMNSLFEAGNSINERRLIAQTEDGLVAVVQDRYVSKGGYYVVGKTEEVAAEDEVHSTDVGRPVYRLLFGHEISSKPKALAQAEVIAASVQGQDDPFVFVIPGALSPEIEIAKAKAARATAEEPEYRREDSYRTTLGRLLPKIGTKNDWNLEERFLLAVLLDKVQFDGPVVPVTATQVVLIDDATGGLSEAYIDAREAEVNTKVGDKRVVHVGGSTLDFLLERRYQLQVEGLATLVDTRDRIKDSLRTLQSRIQGVLDDLDAGKAYLGSWGDIPLHLGQYYEESVSRIKEYAVTSSHLRSLNVPQEIVETALKGEVRSRYGWRSEGLLSVDDLAKGLAK